VDSATTQATEDTPSPCWVVKPEATDENWNSAIMSYNALNVKIYQWPPSQITLPANLHRDMDLDVKYGMSVEVALPIQKDGPKVSFVYRHQIHCWVDVNSKARRRGIIVLAANYIPDICTEHSLWIQEHPKLNLVHNHSEGNIPEGDTNPEPELTSEGIFSFATATTSKALTRAPEHFWSPKHLKLWPRAKKPQDKVEQDIPIHRHVCRGWDHTNLQWQKVVWPKLDCKLQPLQGESTAAWRLDWQEGGRAEDVIMEEPQTQGSLTKRPGGPSNAVEIQTEEPGFLEVMGKPDKGKAKEAG